ncbi:hypothetical protein BJ742DRAFT_342023 [Cladochytrium replicatum]|nr:hypothetical protein BJ742DRAFT_342023 [Cladochytrium replicatum]
MYSPVVIARLPAIASACRSVGRAPTLALPASSSTPWRSYSAKPPFERRPGPIPLGDTQQQKEFEELLRRAEADEQKRVDAKEELTHRDQEKEPLPRYEGDINPTTGEQGGPKGPEPTRYGDWERKGRVFDF